MTTQSDLDWDRVLKAQLHVVNYLAFYLPLHPAAWIYRKLKPGFLEVFLAERTRFSTLWVLISAFLWTMLLPCLLAHAFMPYPCGKHTADMYHINPAVISSNGTLVDRLQLRIKQTDCDTADFLRSPWHMGKIGIVLFMFLMFLTLYFNKSSWHRHIVYKYVNLAKIFIPKVFYNGMGPHGTDHSLWAICKVHGCEGEWSFWHDYFGPVELAVYCFLLVCVIFAGIAVTGFVTGGVVGLFAGAALGATGARFSLLALNEVFGASNELIAIIREELRSHQPVRKVSVGMSFSLDEKKLQAAVADAAKYVRSHTVPSQRYYSAIEGANKLANDIEAEGFELLQRIAHWYLEKYQSQVSSPCLRLFEATSVYAAAECDIVALSFLDLGLFLMSYFDPAWTVASKFGASCVTTVEWSRKLRIESFYISHPIMKVCKQKDEAWHVTHFETRRKPSIMPTAQTSEGYAPLKGALSDERI
eukprot:TRINITY_DN6302_c0_g1_i2.p1 TRINITY_DN6302_c0_g1~~TRINITY_DN6302_c0_g1_i2.p1  ORF type:complete len:473 (+),score=39.98 TRINITY_DN6302_c0_g1_i2:117-1535(+)